MSVHIQTLPSIRTSVHPTHFSLDRAMRRAQRLPNPIGRSVSAALVPRGERVKLAPFSGAAGAVPRRELGGAGPRGAFAIAVCLARRADAFTVELDAVDLFIEVSRGSL